MNYESTIRNLRSTAEDLIRAAEALERLNRQPGLPLHKRRGRKSMGPAERAEVSLRMQRYWARQRSAHASPQDPQ